MELLSKTRGKDRTFNSNYGEKMMSRIVATLNRSAGNGEVGEMWIETKIFNISEPLGNVIDWAKGRANLGHINPQSIPLLATLRLTEGD